MRATREEHGQATVMIIGFAIVLAMVVALVVDASAAFLRRQGLDTIADGAALRGADLGATGKETYTGGLPDRELALSPAAVRAAVDAYLSGIGAYRKFPGLTFEVGVDGARRRVTVTVHAPLHLPLTVPGAPGTTSVGATGSAVVEVDAP